MHTQKDGPVWVQIHDIRSYSFHTTHPGGDALIFNNAEDAMDYLQQMEKSAPGRDEPKGPPPSWTPPGYAPGVHGVNMRANIENSLASAACAVARAEEHLKKTIPGPWRGTEPLMAYDEVVSRLSAIFEEIQEELSRAANAPGGRT